MMMHDGDMVELADIRKLVDFAKEHHMKPKTVTSWLQAFRMRRRDPTHHKWRKGERYYLLVTQASSQPVPCL